jgi:rod shape-determining protein MreD
VAAQKSAANSGVRGGSIYLGLLGLAAAVLVQSALVPRLRFLGASADLLLVLVVCLSLIRGVTTAFLWGFAGGLAIDVISGMPLGTSSLALMAVCFLAGLGTGQVFSSSLLLPVVMIALATPLHGWIILLTRQIEGHSIDWVGSTVHIIAPELLLNTLLILLLYPAMRRLIGTH